MLLILAKKRVKDKGKFNWKVNCTWIYLEEIAKTKDGYELELNFTGYSPYYKSFQIRVDGNLWEKVEDFTDTVQVKPGSHRIEARMLTQMGRKGPVSGVSFEVIGSRL